LNDEVNLTARDTELAARITADFQHDLAGSRLITYEEWKRRSIFERTYELFGWLLERQQ
jgi:cardiolipin synthase A/B